MSLETALRLLEHPSLCFVSREMIFFCSVSALQSAIHAGACDSLSAECGRKEAPSFTSSTAIGDCLSRLRTLFPSQRVLFSSQSSQGWLISLTPYPLFTPSIQSALIRDDSTVASVRAVLLFNCNAQEKTTPLNPLYLFVACLLLTRFLVSRMCIRRLILPSDQLRHVMPALLRTGRCSLAELAWISASLAHLGVSDQAFLSAAASYFEAKR